MKSYAIFPTFNLTKNDDRSQACIDLVSVMIVDALRRGGDRFHFVVDWIDNGAASGASVRTNLARPDIHQFATANALMDRVRRSVDPFNGLSGTLRSIATCRAATFGYDGQAFLCLRHEDEPPVSFDATLAVVEQRPEFLVECDYFDGWLSAGVSEPRSASLSPPSLTPPAT